MRRIEGRWYGVRHPYGDGIEIDRVLRLAAETAVWLDIRIPCQHTLRKMISKPEPTPAIYRRDNVALWIDRYYIAFAHDDAPWVHYLYLTRQHIIEERIAALRQHRQRGTRTRIPDAIQWQFSAAWREMNRAGKAYALRPFPWPQGEVLPLDLKASVACLTCCWSSAPGAWTG